MKKVWLFNYMIGFLILWILLTVTVQWWNEKEHQEFGDSEFQKKALIVYHPDLFYNFDEQICNSFAEGLSSNKWKATVATVNAVPTSKDEFDLYVFCANTYNFAPDWAIQKFIKKLEIQDKPVINITLGAGTTERAQRLLDDLVREKNGNLLDSKAYWLMRPNDDNHNEASNIKVAIEKANDFGKQVAKDLEGIVLQQ